LVSLDFSAWTLAGMALLIALVAAAWIRNNGQLPAWSLLALGFLAYTGLVAVFGVLGGLVALATSAAGPDPLLFILFFVPWTALIALAIVFLRGQHIPSLLWILFGLIIVSSLLVRVKYFALYGISWSATRGMMRVSLWSAGILLLPVAIGLRLARRHGAHTVLFVVGTTFLWFQSLINHDHRLDLYMDNSVLFTAFIILLPLLFTVIAPLCFLLAGSARGRIWGLLVPVGLAVVVCMVVTGLVRGDFTLIIWLGAIPYTLSILLNLALAYLLYRQVSGADC